MESIYSPELISMILNFLDKDSIKKFCCVFKDQDFIKECLKYTRISRLIKCKWVMKKEMKSLCETVFNTNLDRVSDICIDLCINKKTNTDKKKAKINFENNKITKLHIDLKSFLYGSLIEKIKSTSLIKLTLVYCQVNKDFFIQLKENCPKLKFLTFVYVKTDNGVISEKYLL